MPPKTDAKVLKCISLFKESDGSSKSLSASIKKSGLDDTEATRRNIRKHMANSRQGQLANALVATGHLSPAEAAIKAAEVAAKIAIEAAEAAKSAATKAAAVMMTPTIIGR